MGALTPQEGINIDDLTKPVSEERINADISTMEMGLVVTQEGEDPKNVVELVKAGAFSHLKAIDIDDKDMADEVWGTMQALKKCRTTLGNVRLALTGPWEEYKKRLIKKEKDIVAVIEPEEKRLKAVHDDWEARRNDRAAEEERRENARIQERIQRVLATGAVYNETSGDYRLGDIALNATQVKILSDDGFAKAIASMEQAAEVKKKAEEAERQKEQRYRERKSEAFTIGAKYDGAEYSVVGSDMQATDDEMRNYSDAAWDAVTSSWKKAIQKAADDAKAEQERKDKEAKEAADKLEAERKKKEEDDAKMKAMQERITRANLAELLAAGWVDYGASVMLDSPTTNGFGTAHLIAKELLADMDESTLATHVESGKSMLANRERIALLNKRKQVMFDLGFTDGREVMSSMFLTDDPAHDLVLGISHEQLATQSEEGFAGYLQSVSAATAKHNEVKAEREAKVKKEEKAERNRPVEEPSQEVIDGSTPDIVPAESGEDAALDAFRNEQEHKRAGYAGAVWPVEKPHMQTPLVGQFKATFDVDAKATGVEFVENPEGTVMMGIQRNITDVFAQPEATKTDAEKDAYWFTVWADLLEKETGEFEGRLKTEKAKAKFKAHKRYLENVIDGIRKAAEQITQQP